MENIDINEMISRFLKIASATIYDVLDYMGLPNQCMSLGIKPIKYGMHVAGPALTIRGNREPRYKDEYLEAFPKFRDFGTFRAVYPGCTVVINAEKDQVCGHWGEMMSYSAKQLGATGVVIDGGSRDLEGLLAIPDWPVFLRYTTPIESEKRWRAEDINVPIYVTGSLTTVIRVNPGDWIVGDSDGVMVIPKELALEVLFKAEEVEIREEGTRRELAAGVPIKRVFEKYKRM